MVSLGPPVSNLNAEVDFNGDRNRFGAESAANTGIPRSNPWFAVGDMVGREKQIASTGTKTATGGISSGSVILTAASLSYTDIVFSSQLLTVS
jgi:hypothetical protein